MKRGPCAKFAFDPDVVGAYMDDQSKYVMAGSPPRRRRTINGTAIHPHDARVLRRWRSGQAEGATQRSVVSMLHHYGLTLDGLHHWATCRNLQPILRGQLNLAFTPNQESPS